LKRYDNKRLLPLENHTSADAQSGRLGDIEVVDEQGNSFEVVEVKHEIPISINVVERAKEKILPSTVTRYYILSTAEIKNSDKDAINGIIHQVKNSHGCQIVVNGIIPSLKYYLRLLENPTSFLANYVELLNVDEALKFEHKVAWNNIIANL
jgi:DNA (cytosine-5)-methyltransferase 1